MHTWEFITLFHLGMYFKSARAKTKQNRNFPGGPVVKNPPGNIGDTGLTKLAVNILGNLPLGSRASLVA